MKAKMQKQQAKFKQQLENQQKQKKKSERDMDKKAAVLLQIAKFVAQQQFAASNFDDIRNHIIEMINVFERDPDAELQTLRRSLKK